MAGMMERRRIRRRAGASAALEYERRKRAWHAQHHKEFLTVAVIAAVIVIATLIAAWHVWPWVGGMASGAALTFYIAMWESPPTWIENWQMGAFGEERTAKILMPLLKRGWVIVHDLNRIKSNLDHVLIGPSGVFVLDTKNMHGTAQADGDRLSLTRPGETRVAYSHDRPARQARAQGVDLNRVLRQRCQLSPWVTAVVVLWADFPQQVVAGRSMSYVHGDHLVDWLLAQPARLNANQIDQIAAALRPGQRRRTNSPETDPAATLPTT